MLGFSPFLRSKAHEGSTVQAADGQEMVSWRCVSCSCWGATHSLCCVTRFLQGEDAEQSMQLLPDSDSDGSDVAGRDEEDDESEPYGGR